MACNFELLDYNNYNGDFSKYYNELINIFNSAFKDKKHYLFNKCIKDNDRLWHIISDGSVEQERLINFERAKYLNLLVSILTNQNCIQECGEFHYYEKYHYKSGKNSIRAYIYCPNHKYLVVLEKKSFIYGIITAFPIDTNHKHKKILEDLTLYKKKREPI